MTSSYELFSLPRYHKGLKRHFRNIWYIFSITISFDFHISIAQSVGAIEYADCTSAEG